MKTFQPKPNTNRLTRLVDMLIVIPIITLLIPLWLVNAILSLCKGKVLFHHIIMHDALDRGIKVYLFSEGWWRNSATLVSIFTGKLQLFGVSLHHPLDDQHHDQFAHIPPGIFSLYDIHTWVGLIERNHEDLLKDQSRDSSTFDYCKNICKAVICYELFSNDKLHRSKTFTLFGIKINNTSLHEALDWIFTDRSSESCQVGFFVNVNSVNISLHDTEFKNALQCANRVFADGSGIRLAAAHTGEELRANLNGTDLLPHICEMAIAKDKSIFLLGSGQGIAEAAAKNLINRFPQLQIAGHHHGYFAKEDTPHIIKKINASGAHICLIALGSPLQEEWLIENSQKLHCETALAVGGLLDFVSGKIPRAPNWMREIGAEWVWRLIQEPSKKFNRYVIGNPVFLFRTYVLNQARNY